MRNIFIVPTDQPSRLWINNINGKLVLDEEPNTLHSQHIYITSDEEITGFENNIWVIKGERIFLWQNTMALVSNNKPRKIILTDNPELIADGVQAIDDEFLKWFVKNPTCEFVEVDSWSDDLDGVWSKKYKITIPQKKSNIDDVFPEFELKKDIFDTLSSLLEPKKYPIGGFAPGNYIGTCVTCKEQFLGAKRSTQCEPCAIEMVNVKVEVNDKGGIEIVKQDELEEAAERHYVNCIPSDRHSFIAGASWQSKRMYSESELRELIIKALTHDDDKICGSLVTKDKEIRTANFGVWFEENKKK